MTEEEMIKAMVNDGLERAREKLQKIELIAADLLADRGEDELINDRLNAVLTIIRNQ